ncbi:MAG TPA: ABC transporter permease [Cyclobacteriaceae bacterium]|nr:ABC transporter permease [Cyclobacteriaceae bacterium]
MIRNYFKTAIRTLLRHRFFSAINIFGLAMAMSICMGIIMLVADQLQYDQYNTKKDLIFRVNSLRAKNMEQGLLNSTTPMPLKAELEKYSGIDHVIRFKRGFGNGWMEFEDNDVNVPLAGYFADPGALQMFQYDLQYGDASTALNDPYTVVLTREAADKLFSDENPLGKTVKVGDLGLYTVTGVLKKTENKTHIAFEALASMSSLMSLDAQGKVDARDESWKDFWSTWTYIEIKDGVEIKDIQVYLDKVYDERVAPLINDEFPGMRMQMQSLTEMTPGPLVNNPIGPSLPWILVYVLSGLAAIIMVTSCFNFTNLSIARSLTRAREIGVRKVNGASRMQIFSQFISEAVVVSLCALAISLVLLMFLKPLILQLTFARIFRWDLASNIQVYAVFTVFAVFVGLLAGAFPALVLSKFEPVKVLKSLTNMKLFSKMGLRKALLVSQFTLTLIFILSVTVLYQQLDFLLNKDQGFDMKEQIALSLNKAQSGPLKNELLKHNNIMSVSAASHILASGTTFGDGFKRNMSDKDWTNGDYYFVDEGYEKNLSLTVVAGKFFEEANGESNKNMLVLNETAIKALHFSSPHEAVGTLLYSREDSVARTVVGVVRDYNHQALLNKIEPLVLLYEPTRWSVMQIKYSGTYDEAMKAVTQAYNLTNPGLKVDAKLMEEEVMLLYNTIFGDAVQVLGFIAFLAIVISCLGLLGMATYATETRLKEVSIRKILGSTNGALIYLLSKGFLVILLISVGIGVPAAYFINTLWLELLPYHVVVDLPKIAFGVSMLILFGIGTIGSQTWRATFVNPVDNLKSE